MKIKENKVHGTSHLKLLFGGFTEKVKWLFQEEINELGNMRCNEWKPKVTVALCLPDKNWDGPTFMNTYKTWWGVHKSVNYKSDPFVE